MRPAGAGDSVQLSISPSLHPTVRQSAHLPTCPSTATHPSTYPFIPHLSFCPSIDSPHPQGPRVRAGPRTRTGHTTVLYSTAATAGTLAPARAERPETNPDAHQRGTGGRHRGATVQRTETQRGRPSRRHTFEQCHVVDRHTLTHLTSARCVLVTGQAPCWALGGVSRAGGGRSVDGGRAGPGAGRGVPAAAPRCRFLSTRGLQDVTHRRPLSLRAPA